MGLLEKAKEQKKQTVHDINESIVIKRELDEVEEKKKSLGLLEKAKEKKSQKTPIKTIDAEKNETEEKSYKKENLEYTAITKDGKKIIDEKKGFGYNGLGTRRIVFDDNINEYIYEVSEPVLNENETEIKNELAHLFKMLADINILGSDKQEKKKYLEETLDQIVMDNNIKFNAKFKKSTDKTSFSDLFKKKENKKDKNLDEKETEPEEKSKGLSLFKNKNKKGEKTEENSSESKNKSSVKKDKKNGKTGLNISLKRELTPEEKKTKEKIYYHIFRDFIGYNRIDILMEDEGIEDISCDGSHVPIFIYHKKFDETTTNIKFQDDKELNSFVVRLAQVCGKQISIYSPIVDGKLPDGSRLQTTLAKTVTNGSTFTIRRFKDNPLTPIDLIGFKSFSLDMAAYFWMSIERGASILFCGGTASGKTTALNALSLFIPSQHKVISIEDTREVNLPHKNWIAGTTRAGFSSSDEKTGKDIDMFDLIRAALRQRPKVVMVGEVRGKEAYSLFQAMATGHTAYATVHASSIHTLIQRLENPPIELPRALLTSLDIIVFQNAINIGGKYVRRMTSVTEVIKLDSDTNQLIFMEPFRWVSKTDDRFEGSGTSKTLNNIKNENNWSDERLEQELENRKIVLKWMCKNKINDYLDVGRIVSEYSKYPDKVLKRAKEELKK